MLRTLSASVFWITLAAGLAIPRPGSAQLDISHGGEVWHLDVSGVPGIAADGDFFGNSVAIGDLNGDDRPDLIVGSFGRDVNGSSDGTVTVLYSGADGPSNGPSRQSITEDMLDAGDGSESFDFFGYAVAVGDFDADGFDDLVIGIRGENLTGLNEGAFVVLSGSLIEVSFVGVQYFDQNDFNGTTAEDDDELGRVFAVGDFNGDFFDDLAVGVPLEDIGPVEDSGMIHVLYGSPNGLSTVGHQTFRPGLGGVAGDIANGDLFGSALAAGDFNNDGFDELVIGEPGENLERGKIHLLFGDDDGLLASGLYLGQADFGGVEEVGDQFGASLAVGNFDGDEYNDLAIGAPGEGLGLAGPIPSAGTLHVGYGSLLGFVESQVFDQSDAGGTVEALDRFGEVLAAADIDDDGRDDLVIGVPEEDNGETDSGFVHVLPGSATGLGSAQPQAFSQGLFGIPDDSELDDQFGGALALGDLNGDGGSDLAVGASGEHLRDGEPDEVNDAGQVHLLFADVGPALIFADGFESGDTSMWD